MSPGLADIAEPTAADLAACIGCGSPPGERGLCAGCGRVYETRDGILDAIGELAGRNRVAADFYDGPGWVRFRKWEKLFLAFQGGARRSRMQILRHLSGLGDAPARVLEVGIGDGENLRFLPGSWAVYGVDIARTQLVACRGRYPAMDGRLAWAEAEHLPFPDGTFDACYSVGGFNYFGDHAAAVREMRRVTREGGPVVVADEVPGLQRAGIGHLIGRPSIDKAWLRGLGLDAAFVDMVVDLEVDPPALAAEVLPDAARVPIWNRLGYCLIHPAPGRPSGASGRHP
ncbi:Demethylrebeccamycin-D-glucose O-methyltransferase [Aquisphaera giovannonii]|uniref:Demethylrebeccamycin-D-glucose O-methyltransferase n=1 Tax=Aquisphaera giovannonii TaxID=406548 RepID=A0A5B9VY17_9BACT|nr:class I SAM-dependent methyltransferase [Aquisphaera giovannonii]QEH32615.1 Demethylrebeccamycin-D-glucose O-methyltransferase [Aquisphaera giovannonii]